MLSSCAGAGYTSVILAATCVRCRHVPSEVDKYELEISQIDDRAKKIEPLCTVTQTRRELGWCMTIHHKRHQW